MRDYFPRPKITSAAVVWATSVALICGCGGSSQPSTSSEAQSTQRSQTSNAELAAQNKQLEENIRLQRQLARQQAQQSGARGQSTAAAGAAASAGAPPIVQRPIPFGGARRAEMAAYSSRHYGSFMRPTYRLLHPQVIVEHFTETSTFGQAFNTFVPDQADSELHELPGTCAHFVIDTDGTIYQLVPLGIMCRHTVGLNWTSIGIEHVANSDQQFLNDAPQLRASVALTCWLRSRFAIQAPNVIGHNESLSSPFHREDVASLHTQTHNDLTRSSMQVYRASMRRSCP